MPTRSKQSSAPSLDQLRALARQDRDTPAALADAAELSLTRVDRAFLIPIERIAPMKDNPRQSFRHLDELAESIEDRGLIQPLVVRRDPEKPGHYMTVAGARRLMAANILRGSEKPETRARVAVLPCLVVDEMDDQALASALAENLARDDLTRAEAMAALLRLQSGYGWSSRQIARRTGRSFQDVAELLRIAKDEELSSLVRDEVIAPSAAGELARMEPEARSNAIQEVRTGRLKTVAQIRAANPRRSRPPQPTSLDNKSVSEFRHPVEQDGAADKETYERAHPFAHASTRGAETPSPVGGGPRTIPTATSKAARQSDDELKALRTQAAEFRSSIESHPLLAWDSVIAEHRAAVEEAAERVRGAPHFDSAISREEALGRIRRARQDLEAVLRTIRESEIEDAELAVELAAIRRLVGCTQDV